MWLPDGLTSTNRAVTFQAFTTFGVSEMVGDWDDLPVSAKSRPEVEGLDVLVVDDEPDVASSTADILRSEGMTAGTAGTVEEARQLIATREVRSIILDHQIAGNGESLLAGDLDLPPIVVMSGMDRDALDELQVLHGGRTLRVSGQAGVASSPDSGGAGRDRRSLDGSSLRRLAVPDRIGHGR